MSNLADPPAKFAPTNPDLATEAWVAMLRAAISAVPESQRAAVFHQLRDLLPASLLNPLSGPRRGGTLLNNVFQLFKDDPGTEHSVTEVVEALAKQDDPQPVRLALSYLTSRRILHRIGYGKYRLEDGSIVDGIP
jgi:hypothetical protein